MDLCLFACEEAFDFGIMPLLELTVGTIRSAWTVLKLALDIQNPEGAWMSV